MTGMIKRDGQNRCEQAIVAVARRYEACSPARSHMKKKVTYPIESLVLYLTAEGCWGV